MKSLFITVFPNRESSERVEEPIKKKREIMMTPASGTCVQVDR
jgi:hypothetical protein